MIIADVVFAESTNTQSFDLGERLSCEPLFTARFTKCLHLLKCNHKQTGLNLVYLPDLHRGGNKEPK